MARLTHLFPSRTQKLSTVAVKVALGKNNKLPGSFFWLFLDFWYKKILKNSRYRPFLLKNLLYINIIRVPMANIGDYFCLEFKLK